MALLNAELADMARQVISEMREEPGWTDEDIQWSAAGGILKELERRGVVSDSPDKYELGAILVIVRQVMQEQEPTLADCPYCKSKHEPHLIEQCPLKARQRCFLCVREATAFCEIGACAPGTWYCEDHYN